MYYGQFSSAEVRIFLLQSSMLQLGLKWLEIHYSIFLKLVMKTWQSKS